MTHPLTSDPSPDPRALRRWLQWCIVAVFAAVMIGGVTRLTESGLSITEWKPISGVLPPMTASGWQRAYDAFLQIPQSQTTHAGITLGGFKLIYWWEWFHRLIARGVGLVFAVPYVWLLWRGRIPRRYRVRLAALPLLTLAQGVLGWYMVQSGLAVRSSVSAYRLTAHLALALGILVVALWTWADLRAKQPEGATADTRDHEKWRWPVAAVLVMIALTILSGGFVAGLRAGRIFNTFPLMGGAIVPPGYLALEGWWRNALENPIAAQFHHRILASLTGLSALWITWRARASDLAPESRRAMQSLGAVVLLQVGLGITTLLLAVPVVLGVLHQFVGVLALSTAVLAFHRVQESRAT